MADPEPRPRKSSPERSRKIDIVLLAIILTVGIFLRVTPGAFAPGATLHFLAPLHPQAGWTKIGFDEGLYRQYVNELSRGGLTSYPDIVEGYILTPLIQRKTIFVPPALLLGAQMLFAVLFGVLGVIVAAPLLAISIPLVKLLYVEDVLHEHAPNLLDANSEADLARKKPLDD